MTLVEYVASLQDQNVPESEWFDKVQQWKKENNYEDPNAVKTKDVASQTDANATSTETPEASETLSAVENLLKTKNIQSVYGTGLLPSPKGKQSFDLVGRTAEQISGIVPIFQGVDLNPGETKTANKFDFKYEIGEDKQPVFYTKPEGQEDWINVTANKAKNPDAELGAAEELGFNVGDFDREKALKRKKIKKDFSIGNILSNAKLEPPKPYVEEVGKFLTPSEIEARQNAQKARVAIGVEDLDLDKKISDSIYENNLDIDNFYSQFKDKNYSGKYVQDLGPNIYKKIFEDFNPDKINNFASSDDFLGFLNEKGYMQDYIDLSYGPGLTMEGEDAEVFKLGKQRKIDNYFKLYMEEANSKYTNQILLSYIVKNKEKFKNVKSLSEAYDLAKKHFKKEYDQSTFELISYNDYNAYREEQFPELVSAEKKLQAVKKAKSEELIKEGSSEGLLQDSFTKFYDGVISRATEQSYELREFLGFDMGFARLSDTENNIKKSAEDVRYGYIEGKKAEVDGVEYIKDSNGSIYNITNKVAFVPSSKEEFEKINKALDESEETDSSFSTAGSTEQFFATSGTMLFDIASIYGIGKVTKATKLGTLTNAIRIPKASFDTMSYYTFAGYVSSKKNIYEELIAAGVNETEARAIAEEGARVAGLWTGGTSLIAPIPSYLKQFDKILGNRSILQSAIKGYRKNGPTGFINNFKETLKNIKITKDGVIKTGIAGTQEFAQEQIQQYGEYTGVNAYVNRLLGRDVLKQTYDRQDFINTGIVSFASGSAFANLNIPGFKPSAAQQLNNLYLLGKDTTQTQKLLNEMVAEGKATQEEAGKVMSGIRSVKNQMSRIPASVSAETKLESARLQQDIADLQAKKSRTDEVYHASIDSQIDAKKKELAEIVKPELEKAAARKGSKIATEQLGAGFENFSTQQDMDSAAESLAEDGWEVQDSTGYGMALTKGKQKIILINDQAAAEDNRYTTDQHEVLHPFWEAALKANPKAAIDLGKALMVEIINNKDINAGTELFSRFSRYLSDENYSAENTWEEVIPLVSEALSNGDITYNKKQEGWWKNLGTKISDFLKGNKKPLSLEFNTGKDVFDFIEGYNKSIEAGKGLTKEQLEVAEKGAKGKLIEEGFDQESTYTVKEGETIQDVADKFDTTVQNLKDLNKTSGADLKAGDNLIVDAGVKIVERASDIKAAQQIKESVAKESKRVEDSQEVQKLYDEQGVSAAFDIIQKFKPITNRIVESRSQAPNFDRQLLTDEIETGPRGILDLISEYKPESGVPLAAFINKFLPARSIEASKRVLGEEFTTDVTEAKGVMAEETTKVETKEKPIAKKPTETVEFSQAQIEKIGAKNKAEVETKITEATKESFKDQDVKTFGQTRNVPKAVADIYAGMFGLNPQTITDKTRNYQKTDAEGLTTAKQFLLKNANNDFARLPETKDGFGKGTFLPRNVMNALYTNGKLTGTLKDYMDLIRQKPTKPIYRDAVGQTIRGLLNLHIRNRMFESLVPTTAKRAVGGAKFSKRIADNKINETDLDLNARDKNKFLKVVEVSVEKGFTLDEAIAMEAAKIGRNRGFAYENVIIRKLKELKIEGFEVSDQAGGNKVGIPDFAAKIFSANFDVEVKLEKAQYSNVGLRSRNQDIDFNNIAKNKNYTFLPKLRKDLINPAKKAMKLYRKRAGELGADLKLYDKTGKLPFTIFKQLQDEGLQKAVTQTTVFNQDIVSEIYENKVPPTNYIQLKNSGLFFMGKNPLGLPVPELTADVNVTLRISRGSRTVVNGVEMVGVDLRILPDKLTNVPKSNYSLDSRSSIKALMKTKQVQLLKSKEQANAVINNPTLPTSISFSKKQGGDVVTKLMDQADKALNNARKLDAPVKKIRVFDFDDTLARSKSMVIVNMPDGSSRKINATEFAAEAANLEEQGAEFDFTEFSQVIDGKKGPLFSVAEKIAAARGTDDIFILTARPADAAGPIQAFMKANGIDLKLENIVGLGDGTAAAKGRWIASKAAEGYNDFYFADDAIKNVQAVKDALSKADVKSKVQQAKVKFSKRLGKDLAKNKNYTKFRDGLKGSVFYHGGTASLSDNKAVWFTVDDFDAAEIYAERKDGKVYSIDSNNLKNAIIIPDIADLVGLDKVIKRKHKSVADQVFDEYGQVDIKKVLETDSASEIISDIINYVDNNFELADGVYGPETLYDNSGKISKGTPVIVIGGNVSTKVRKVEVPKSMRTIPSVSDVLSQVDVKSKVQQAKASKRITFDKVFNNIIEAKTGIESYKQFSAAKAKTVGSSKGKFTFFTTPSAEDFVGLLYKTLGKGKVGDAQMAFYKTNLIDPYNRAEMAISQAKVAAGRDYKELKKQFKNIPKTLEKETGIAKYTYQHAIRTYIWDTQGIEVPGLSKRDQKRLTDFIKADPELQAFADQLVNIQKGKPYPRPDKDWTAGNITTDVISGINKVNRAEYLQEWQENVDIIFSEKNMNKLEAAFGAKYVEALKDSLRAMKSGSNRPLGGDRVSNQILDWLNNSVGAIMFLNTRSAVLQTISAVNFINWGDNNILKAGKAFANQKQFWSDFLTLMNSDYLLERRDGLKINVSESEIADAVEGSDNKVKAAISYLLNKGFVLTRYADSFAIASGGATFYRNRIESLVEQGMDRKAAEQQAFEDFRLIAEENQQSSSPMRISQQQRSLIGRIVLQFGNTQLQYVRIQKRAVQDLVNGRGDWRANISKIVYYGAIQNIMFNALQSGLAWALFDDDEDDEELTESNKEQKLERALNGAIDSQLKGLGIQGAVVAGVKNALMTIAEQADKKSPKFEEALDDLLSIAPALGSKIRKLKSAARTVSWNRKEIKEKGFSMDNPAYLAGAQTISAVFNIPLDRAVMKMNNMRNILNPATENWQKVALALGWSGWDVGLPYFGLAEDKPVLTETEKQTKKLFDLNKSDQVKMLLDLGLSKKEIRALKKEQQRVDQIIKLQNKKKDGKDKP